MMSPLHRRRMEDMMAKYTRQDILDLIEEEDVKFIRLQFTDIAGNLKNTATTVDQIDKILSGRCRFNCAAVDGSGRCCLCTPASCFAAARNSCSLLSSAIYVLFSSDFQFLLCTSLSRYCRHWCCCRLWYTCGSRSMVIILCIIFRFRWQHI